MESLIYAKELVKKNSLRIALGASLIANAAIGTDAALRDGEGVQDVVHTLYESGKSLGTEILNSTCDNPDYYQENKKMCDEPSYPEFNW